MSDIGATVAAVISIGKRQISLAPGQEFPFGRHPGPGQNSESNTISSQHGLVQVAVDSWSVTSTGTFYGFTVLDLETPSRLVVPVGAGPVVVPFAHAIIAVEIEHLRYLLEVDSVSLAARNWQGAWKSHLNREVAATSDDSSGTHLGWADARFVHRNGRPLRWYQVLVAMCEPRLRHPASQREDRIPTNREIAQRLGVSVRSIENHHLDRLRTELGFPRFSEQMRLGAVLLAISQGIVTSADLTALDMDSEPAGGTL